MGGASPWRRELAGAAAEERGEVAVGGAARGEVVMALGVGADRREPGSPTMDASRRGVGRMQLGSTHESSGLHWARVARKGIEKNGQREAVLGQKKSSAHCVLRA